jgi:membrane protease YdiL (CAAX protease family)
MKFLEKGFLGDTRWWKYVLTFLLVFVGILLFSTPHSFAIGLKTTLGEVDVNRLDDISYMINLFDPNVGLVYMIFPFVGGLAALLFSVKKVHKQNLISLTTGRNSLDWNRVLFSFSIWGIAVAFFVVIQYFMMPESLILNFQLKPFLILFLIAVVLIPIQTSFEEYMFRGYLMQSLGVLARNRWFPLLFTSAVFGAMHAANPEVEKLGYELLMYYIGTGFFLGIIALMDDGIELSLGFHAANNLISALLVTTDWTVFQTYSLFKDISEPNLVMAILPSLVLFPMVAFIFARKYGWTSWKERLTGTVIPLTESHDDGKA